eukprot:TRINITY_DN1322_c0_g1_i2.p1 TRINITY_DN1322_c0_g1~~TRINITY_DN1322_c0_g1_i2.p1  ORF type:complete len:434 (+),score=110.77 TRINITY_DN1322_c0_g1_i2:73-1374(+)
MACTALSLPDSIQDAPDSRLCPDSVHDTATDPQGLSLGEIVEEADDLADAPGLDVEERLRRALARETGLRAECSRLQRAADALSPIDGEPSGDLHSEYCRWLLHKEELIRDIQAALPRGSEWAELASCRQQLAQWMEWAEQKGLPLPAFATVSPREARTVRLAAPQPTRPRVSVPVVPSLRLGAVAQVASPAATGSSCSISARSGSRPGSHSARLTSGRRVSGGGLTGLPPCVPRLQLACVGGRQSSRYSARKESGRRGGPGTPGASSATSLWSDRTDRHTGDEPIASPDRRGGGVRRATRGVANGGPPVPALRLQVLRRLETPISEQHDSYRDSSSSPSQSHDVPQSGRVSSVEAPQRRHKKPSSRGASTKRHSSRLRWLTPQPSPLSSSPMTCAAEGRRFASATDDGDITSRSAPCRDTPNWRTSPLPGHK